MKRRLSVIAVLVLIVVGSGIYGLRQQRGANAQTSNTPAAVQNGQQPTEQPEPLSFDMKRYSLTDAASPWVIANKQRPLNPLNYTPTDLVIPQMQLRSNITSDERQLRQVAANALNELSQAAKNAGMTLILSSGYRSYNFQTNLYNHYVNVQGKAVADSQSARPGHSEHQTGLAADVGGITRPSCNVEECFKDTPEGQWVAAHAHEHGFIIRYPSGKDTVTGYIYEPWHLRYVGTELAAELHSKGSLTLEEFFKTGAAPDYN